MNIVIVEDEKVVLNRLQRLIADYFGDKLSGLKCFQTLDDADEYIQENSVDLLCLDLNLAGRDGFELLKSVLSSSFHTIVVSANTDRAIEAFEYGVLDFVAKPFTRQRLFEALSRFGENNAHQSTKYISLKRGGKLELHLLTSVIFIKADNVYSEVYMTGDSPVLHDKSLRKFEQVLPSMFKRVHKSYIINMMHAQSIIKQGKELIITTKGGYEIPVSRKMHSEFKDTIIK
ncbi:DNA-binding response regulator [Alteromonas sediminis]|uniref:DNA-binding response regulator n=1 Tax=Alteromonas sediminis TaxID=2259342 RepID=A0A3N5Y2T9_9ALTE|nr:LytTR family DNA-binding domain-containing protein [Alteromonas sediminis]RPJ67383.1 DNA-binding response regulator [Alteromonas sediminis]